MIEKNPQTETTPHADHSRAFNKLVSMMHIHSHPEDRPVQVAAPHAAEDSSEESSESDRVVLMNVETTIAKLNEVLGEMDSVQRTPEGHLQQLQHVKQEVGEALAYLPANTGNPDYDNVLSVVYSRLNKLNGSVLNAQDNDVIETVKTSVDQLSTLTTKPEQEQLVDR